MWEGVSLHHKTDIVYIKGNLTAAYMYFQHGMLDTVEKPQRNAVAA